MKIRRLVLAAGSLVVAAVVICVLIISYWHRRPPPTSIDSPKLILAIEALKNDPPKLVAAAQAFSRDQVSRGQPLPSAVMLRDLVTGRYISAEDVRVFDGMDVTIYPTVGDTNPQAILIRAQMPDGFQIATMADGSVQQLPK
jgi:Flp pilus assembly protein CpaB